MVLCSFFDVKDCAAHSQGSHWPGIPGLKPQKRNCKWEGRHWLMNSRWIKPSTWPGYRVPGSSQFGLQRVPPYSGLLWHDCRFSEVPEISLWFRFLCILCRISFIKGIISVPWGLIRCLMYSVYSVVLCYSISVELAQPARLAQGGWSLPEIRSICMYRLVDLGVLICPLMQSCMHPKALSKR